MDGTYIDVQDNPVIIDGERYPVSGWIGYAKDPYKDEVMAGVRIYARGKIVAQTRDFDIKTGFTGEFKMRSYLTGAVNAEWLDEDEDLVRTDRQDIIWNSEVGSAFMNWGIGLLKQLASRAESSTTKRVWDLFLENSQLDERLKRAIPYDEPLQDAVMSAARALISKADRDSLGDELFVERIVNLAFTVGPHRSLLETLDQIASLVDKPLDAFVDLFEKARLVETYALGQVARARVEVVDQLRELISSAETYERSLQELIENAPWVIFSEWTPLSSNQAMSTMRQNFESWYPRKLQHRDNPLLQSKTRRNSRIL